MKAATARPSGLPLLATTPLAEPFMHAMYEKVAGLLLDVGFAAREVMADHSAGELRPR